MIIWILNKTMYKLKLATVLIAFEIAELSVSVNVSLKTTLRKNINKICAIVLAERLTFLVARFGMF